MRISLKEEDYSDAPLFEQKNFKDLTFSQKLSYIWDYYKWWFLGAAIVITLLVVTVPGIIENSKEEVLYSVFLNSNIQGQESTTIMDDYTKAAGIDMDNKRITLDCSIYIDRENSTTASMQSSQKLTALFSAKKIDVILSDEANFEFCSSQGAYMDLKELLPDDLCEKYKDSFVEAANPETGEMTAYGLKLTDNQILKDENAFDIEPVVSVCLTTDKKDNAIAFIKYLLGEI